MNKIEALSIRLRGNAAAYSLLGEVELPALLNEAATALMSQVEPIATAPKDGTWVLIFEEWNNGRKHRNWTISRFHEGRWVRSQTRYPSHWMPLPAEPGVTQ